MNSPSRLESLDEVGPIRKARGWLSHLASRILPKRSAPDAPRLLFLDDDSRRAEIFLAENPRAVWVQSVVDCLDRLGEAWDEVHLDHDLGGKQNVAVDNVDCGMEVIRWLCKEPRDHLRSTRFFVHTHNIVAGLLMVLQMRSSGFKAEYRPFGQDLAKVLAHNEPDGEQSNQDGVLNHASNRWLSWANLLRWPAKKSGMGSVRPDPDGEPAAARSQRENCQ